MTNEEKKQKRREYYAAYYQTNKEKVLSKNRAWFKNNPDKRRILAAAYKATHDKEMKEYQAAYHKAHPKDKEVVRARNAEWHKNNPRDRHTENAVRYAANADKERARALAWAKAHPEERAANHANRRARVNGAEGRHTGEEIKQLLAKQKYCCSVCKKSIENGYHRDHIIPLVRGGSNLISNIQLLCSTCNLKKGRKDPIAFMQEQGFLI